MTHPRAVIFDLDGTLADSELDFDAMRAEIGLRPGIPILEQLAECDDALRARAEAIMRRHERAAIVGATLTDGCADLLAHLAALEIPMGILTRNIREVVQTFARTFALRFNAVYTREDGPPKPSPARSARPWASPPPRRSPSATTSSMSSPAAPPAAAPPSSTPASALRSTPIGARPTSSSSRCASSCRCSHGGCDGFVLVWRQPAGRARAPERLTAPYRVSWLSPMGTLSSSSRSPESKWTSLTTSSLPKVTRRERWWKDCAVSER